jgi:hypothetical protein
MLACRSFNCTRRSSGNPHCHAKTTTESEQKTMLMLLALAPVVVMLVAHRAVQHDPFPCAMSALEHHQAQASSQHMLHSLDAYLSIYTLLDNKGSSNNH